MEFTEKNINKLPENARGNHSHRVSNLQFYQRRGIKRGMIFLHFLVYPPHLIRIRGSVENIEAHLYNNSAMKYTALTDPFDIKFTSEQDTFEAKVQYVKSSENCAYYFEVTIAHPEPVAAFFLKEKPILTPEFEYMVWVDEQDRQKAVYQEIGHSIQRHLREKEGIYMMDVAVQNN
jgi:hypothetical protein